MTPLLSVCTIDAAYSGVRVLSSISIDVAPGEFVALVGPNGAGKSTLLKTIAGLLPIRAGEIWLDGERIDGLPAYAIAARGVTLVPEGRRLFAPLTVRENLELGTLTHPRDTTVATLGLLDRFFPLLTQKRSVAAGHLSGGEQQVVALARGLGMRPRLLCLDDPFLGLDRAATQSFCRALADIAPEGQRPAILAVGQHVRRLLELARRAYLLDEGRVVMAGTGQELLAEPQVRRALLP